MFTLSRDDYMGSKLWRRSKLPGVLQTFLSEAVFAAAAALLRQHGEEIENG